ncbi:hypothetical protein Cme02nite_37920 [Catellatospora methionotrophica]|uniref:Kinase n=1 Tax=Catellatospora methionotrophica TaxID=121620 RepID=A0A8J3LJ69_9ACTN|nr:AAA family ATPase [Catellatospora methionotrophica]GIG15460.1 hypothetical protein Cme02nite_37920 [Catellatospora methionotrophica]
MPTLYITRGLPSSGKSTWAEQQQAADPTISLAGRDRVRRMLSLAPWPYGDEDALAEAERRCTIAQAAVIRRLLEDGCSVIVDDTSLLRSHVEGLAELAEDLEEVDVYVVSRFLDVPVEECIRRDVLRPEAEQAGADRIRAMWQRHLDDLAMSSLQSR